MYVSSSQIKSNPDKADVATLDRCAGPTQNIVIIQYLNWMSMFRFVFVFRLFVTLASKISSFTTAFQENVLRISRSFGEKC